MKKSELKKKATSIFEKNKDIKKLYVTADGQPFVSENAANLHARTSRTGTSLDKKALEIFTFENDLESEENPPLSKTTLNKKTLKELEVIAEEVKAEPQPDEEGKKLTKANYIDAILDKVATDNQKED